MKPDRADTALLIDIANHTKRLSEFIAGQTQVTFEANAEKQAAVAHHVMIIGEVARRLSVGFKDTHPSIPWANIASMRNRLIHDYGDVDLDILWTVATERVPDLARYLDPLLPVRPPDAV